MAKKDQVSDSDYEPEHEEQRSHLHEKKNMNKKDVDAAKVTVSESEYEEGSSEEEGEETSSEERGVAARGPPKFAATQGSESEASDSESNSESEEVNNTTSSNRKAANQVSSKEARKSVAAENQIPSKGTPKPVIAEENQVVVSKGAPKPLTAEESEHERFSGGEEDRRLLTKNMVYPLLDTPADDELEGYEESSDKEDTREQKGNGENKMVAIEKPRPTKRVADTIEINSRELKRATASASKPFERKWSPNDEILLLDEMLKNKSNPNADSSAQGLISSIVNSCHFDFEPNLTQLREKINKMRSKYKKNAERVDHSSLKPHDIQVFNLSRKLWGDMGDGRVVANEAKKIRDSGNRGRVVANEAKKIRDSGNRGRVVAYEPKKIEEGGKLTHVMKSSPYCTPNGMIGRGGGMMIGGGGGMMIGGNGGLMIGGNGGLMGGGMMIGGNGGLMGGGVDYAVKETLKEGFELVRGPQPWESHQRWTELRINECELYLKKVYLMKDQLKLALERLDLIEEPVMTTLENLKASLREMDED